jgi:hypothetical protein
MHFEAFSTPALWLLVVTSLILLVGIDWRLLISALGVQYVGVFVLVALTWPLEMAVIKLVAGWISAAVLGMELISTSSGKLQQDRVLLSARLFRFFLAVLVILAITSLAPAVTQWMLNATYNQVFGGLLLMGMAVIQLGVSDRPFRVMVGILTFLSGFEIIYASVETTALVAGALAFFTLSLALIGSYFMTSSTLEADL